MGSAASTLKSSVDVPVQRDPALCTHRYLQVMEGKLFCSDCRLELVKDGGKYDDLIAREIEAQTQTPVDILPPNISAGLISAHRGVKIGFLVAFTKFYDCAEWTGRDVIRRIIRPATAKTRCRACELPHMAPYVGRAQTFISYAQAGKWGDLVAAVTDGGANYERYVWLDAFAVRQWPSQCPDLDFASTIQHCTSFIAVCSSLEQVRQLEWQHYYHGKSEILDKDVSKQIYFLRVWCLAEMLQCHKMNIPYILKGGSHTVNDLGEFQFVSDSEMLKKLQYMVCTLTHYHK